MFGWFKALSIGRKILVGLVSFATVGTGGAAILPASQQVPPPPPPVGNTQQISSPRDVQSEQTETKTVTEEQVMPFETITQNDPTLTAGKTVVTVLGVSGVKTVTYEVIYTNGTETSRKQISEEITKQPVSQVAKVGIKSAQLNCSNGTYINSAGSVVCRPYSSPTTPAGATAQCRDGTYSFSQSRSGTCSHHGGVARWL